MHLSSSVWRNSGYLCAIVLCLFACTSAQKDSPPNGGETNAPERGMPDSLMRTSEPKVHIVEIRQMKFEPGEVRVHKGETIRWINKDITDHDVTEQATKAWASSPLPAGASWNLVATESADYYCNLHQVMKGKIIVE